MQDLPISLINSTYEIKCCPLCNSKNSKFYKYFYKNRYTEEFSNLIGVRPDYLMRNVFKGFALNASWYLKEGGLKKILRTIYNKSAPHHPKWLGYLF